MDGGVPCTSRTPLSSKMKGNLNCVQQCREETGLGFEMMRKAVAVHRPRMVSMECVVQLMEVGGGSSRSDAQYIEDSMKDLKTWAYHQKMNSHDYAGEVDRVRCWWAACAGVHPNQYQLATSWFTRLLALFKMTGANMSIDQHMDQTEDERVESSSRLNIPLFSSFGPRGTQSKQDAPDWKLDHLDVCKAHKFPWPLVDKKRKCVVQTPSMLAIAGLFPENKKPLASWTCCGLLQKTAGPCMHSWISIRH